jgi:ubiquitin-like protein Pup
MSQKEKETRKREETGTEPDSGTEPGSAPPSSSDRVKKVQEEAEDILDKIDEVLEKNAASFVKSFIQKGGE